MNALSSLTGLRALRLPGESSSSPSIFLAIFTFRVFCPWPLNSVGFGNPANNELVGSILHSSFTHWIVSFVLHY